MQDIKFVFAVIGLGHDHIFGMTEGLVKAGAELKWVYDENPKKVTDFVERYAKEGVQAAESEEQILADQEVKLVAAAGVTSERAALGIRVMEAGKDYFVDKAPLTTLEQLEQVKEAVKRTGKKYMVNYSERLQSEGALYAGELIKKGAIGRVLQVLGMGPHRLRPDTRPDWFYEKDKYGGILCDIGSHQIEQFLYFTGATDAVVTDSRIANYNHPQYPELDDFGDASLIGNNGTTGYFRVDWFTPDGLTNWGDGRTFILGTEGYIELRKFVDVTRDSEGDHVFWVDKEGEHYENVHGKIGFPYFEQLISDCIHRTEYAMGQEHALKAAELCVRAQMQAKNLTEQAKKEEKEGK